MNQEKQELIQKLTSATHILVTVSSNPSVDQLAACIGLSLWLNKLDKHATAVFSGAIPSTIEFLEPESTIEKTTDSLRDFIIALDKTKASKLRYKQEDNFVKIFITPYRTNLSSADLEFSQGDFNVDTIIALGVSSQKDLDEAITSHGRILHDAVVMTVNTSHESSLGMINWQDSSASSLAELCYELGYVLGKDQLDPQIANALLTGIVAATNRFSSANTTPNTLTVASELMAAGANQQLVASKLEISPPSSRHKADSEDTTNELKVDQEPITKEADQTNLTIDHTQENPVQARTTTNEATNIASKDEPTIPQVELADELMSKEEEASVESGITSNQPIITDKPENDSVLSASIMPDNTDNQTPLNPLANKSDQPIINRDSENSAGPANVAASTIDQSVNNLSSESIEDSKVDDQETNEPTLPSVDSQQFQTESSDQPTSLTATQDDMGVSDQPLPDINSIPTPLEEHELVNSEDQPSDSATAVNELEAQARSIINTSADNDMPEPIQALNAQNFDLNGTEIAQESISHDQNNNQPSPFVQTTTTSTDSSGHKIIMPPNDLNATTPSLEELLKQEAEEENSTSQQPPEVPPPFMPPVS